MKTIKGTIKNIRRDVRVESDSENGTETTIDITDFELAGKQCRYESNEPTYDKLSESDELVAVGKERGANFKVIAYRNLTKNTNSYGGRVTPVFRIMSLVCSLFAVIALIGVFLLPEEFFWVAVSIGFSCGVMIPFFLYFDRQAREAIRLLEAHR